MIELGIMSFADMLPDTPGATGQHAQQRLAELMEEIRLADELGLDVFGIGEHHRPDYAVSSPATLLAAAAVLTKKIRLSSAVTVLSSDDPVRVYQQFASVDLLSSGRAEIMAGRGSFIESFPLFGYDLRDYDELFTSKLDLLLKLCKGGPVTWQGPHRPALKGQFVFPQAVQVPLPVWVAVGGTPASAVRAATLGLPLVLAIIGGMPEQFVPFINLYKNTALKQDAKPEDIRLAVNNHVFIAEDAQDAADSFYPYYAEMMNRVGRERGWPPLNQQQYEGLRSPRGALMVGSPQQVIDKILYEHELFGFTRFLAQASIGTVPHKLIMKSIELFGTKVAPVIRKATWRQ